MRRVSACASLRALRTAAPPGCAARRSRWRRRSPCRRWRWWLAVHAGSASRARASSRATPRSLTVLDANGERVAPGRDVRGRRETGCRSTRSRRTSSTRPSRRRTPVLRARAASIRVGVLRAALARRAARPARVRRLDDHHAARPPARPRTARTLRGKAARRWSSPARHRARAVEARDPRAVPEPRLLRQRRLGRRGGRARLLRQAGGGAVAGRRRAPGGAAARARRPTIRSATSSARDAPAPAHPRPDAGARASSRRRRALAERTPLVFRREHPELRAPHFVEHVLAQLCRRLSRRGADRRDDARLPAAAAARGRGARPPGGGRRPRHLAGGRGRAPQPRRRGAGDGRLARLLRRRATRGAVNVTTIRRRPGSTLKPFVYGAGARGGDTPATIAYDVVLPGETREPTPRRSSSTASPAIARRSPARTTWPPCTRWRAWARRRWSEAARAPA